MPVSVKKLYRKNLQIKNKMNYKTNAKHDKYDPTVSQEELC